MRSRLPSNGESRGRRTVFPLRRQAVAAGVVSVAVALVCAACASSGSSGSAPAAGSKSDAPIQLGAIVAESGPLAPIDANVLAGFQLGIKAVNKQGGVDGRQLVLSVRDGQSLPTVGTTAAQTLMSQKALTALLVGTSSSTTAALAPVAAAHQVPTFSYSVLPSPTQAWEYEVSITTDQAVGTAVDFLAHSLKLKRVALIASQTVQGQQVSAAFSRLSAGDGMKVTKAILVPSTTTNLSSQVASLASSGTQAIYDFDIGAGEISVAQAAQADGLKIPLYQAVEPSPASALAIYKGGPTYFRVLPAETPAQIGDATQRSLARDCVQAYQGTADATQSKEGTVCYGYTMILLLAKVIEAAHGHTDGAALTKVLDSGFKFAGTGQSYDFSAADHSGVASQPFLGLTGQRSAGGNLTIAHSATLTP